MKVAVDPEICEGCESCVELCPEVFDMEGDVAVARHIDVPEDLKECAQDAADSCPVDAISVY